ncbi:MAG: extensin family protein [Hyphomicrobiaceae bacterium]
MYLRVALFAALFSVCSLTLWGCSQTAYFIARPEPWRQDEERACLGSGWVREQPWLVARASLGASSDFCGALRPFQMSAALGGRVALKPPALVRCNMVPAIERWAYYVAEPAARRIYGASLAEVKVIASYSCRPMNGIAGSKLSEHGHANAIDVAGFKLTDGRFISVKSGWFGDERDRAFLRQVHQGACSEFKTVLGPDANRFHRDHFHFDLARHGRSGQEVICK